MFGGSRARSEADSKRSQELLEGLDFLLVQDVLMTQTAEMADVVLPASLSWCEVDGGTVTNSERRVQRMRKALDPPGQARDDHWIIYELARRLGHDWGHPTLEEAWDELRSLQPRARGRGCERLDQLGGSSGPARARAIPARCSSTAACRRRAAQGPKAPFSITTWVRRSTS